MSHQQKRRCQKSQQESLCWVRIVEVAHALGRVSKAGHGSAFSIHRIFRSRRPAQTTHEFVSSRRGSEYTALLTKCHHRASLCRNVHLCQISHSTTALLWNWTRT